MQEKKRIIRRKIDQTLIDELVERIKAGKKIRRSLNPSGRIYIERQLPFLCVYRQPDGSMDGDEKLVMGEASYLIAPAEKEHHEEVSSLVSSIASCLAKEFGAFLVIEVWTKPYVTTADMPASPPRFKIHRAPIELPHVSTDALFHSLKGLRIQKQPAVVSYAKEKLHYPSSLEPLISYEQAEAENVHFIGIEVADIFRDSNTLNDFPRLKQMVWRGLSKSLKKMIFEFVQEKSSYKPAHYQALGKKSLVKTVWSIDEQLAEISQQLDLVLSVTPTNTMEAYREFKAKNFEKQPKFLYRPLKINPVELKRQLYSINIDKIEDPAMSQLFLLQQRGLDSKISLMADRGTPRFLYGSMQLYGQLDYYHIDLARFILDNVPSKTKNKSKDKVEMVGAEELKEHAEAELAYYNNLVPSFKGKVEIRDDIPGVLVSKDTLLIGDCAKVSRPRLEALLHHEIGTHMLTYFNGEAQPFRQLKTGLIGYDELQEGLAVLSEFLHEGLTADRLRTLAARMVICKMLIDGATFVDAFKELTTRYGFGKLSAFRLITRVYRGGGLTKDSVYLRGLIWLLDYFRRGGEAEHLFIGKYPIQFMHFIRELMWRNVIKKPLVLPKSFSSDNADSALELLRKGISIEDMCVQVNR